MHISEAGCVFFELSQTIFYPIDVGLDVTGGRRDACWRMFRRVTHYILLIIKSECTWHAKVPDPRQE